MATVNSRNLTTRLLLAHRAGSLPWIAELVSTRAVSLVLIAAVVITDRAFSWESLSFVPRALIDEPCHLATALVVLGAITRFRGTPPYPMFGWTMLTCSVLIDIDHLPLEFGSSVLTNGTPRPYTHALWVVVVLTAAAVVASARVRRTRTARSFTAACILAGAAWGISAHFLRDVATAEMSLWWPVTKAAVQVSYWWYVVALLVIVVTPLHATKKDTEVRHSKSDVALCDEHPLP